MNLTITNSPPIAELVRNVLEGRRLVAGQQFYATSNGVVVTVAPLPPQEIAAEGERADHEITVSTGFPPDPATAGMTMWVQRRGETGGQLERLGETDRFGALLFSPGSAGTEYQLTVTRGATVRLESDNAVILPFTSEPPNAERRTRNESQSPDASSSGSALHASRSVHPIVNPCPICRIDSEDWVGKLSGLRDALQCGTPICRSHLHGPGNLVFAAAREGWHQSLSGVFTTCSKLLGDLLDEPGAVRKGFLQQYPSELGNQALNQAAGVLSTAIAAGHVLAKKPARALAAAHAAAVHLQSALGTDRTRREQFASRLTAIPGHPLDALWSQLAVRLRGEWSQGFLAFRQLSEAITQRVEAARTGTQQLGFGAVCPAMMVTDRERGIPLRARLEFLPIADGSGELFVDVVPLGFRVLDLRFLRSLDLAWRAIQPVFHRERPRLGICVRVRVEGDDPQPHALQGSSVGLAIACGLLAISRGETLDEKTVIIGELLEGAPPTDLASFGAGWCSRVSDKLDAAQETGCERAVVGVVDEGVRYANQLDRTTASQFEVAAVWTVGAAYEIVRRASLSDRSAAPRLE